MTYPTLEYFSSFILTLTLTLTLHSIFTVLQFSNKTSVTMRSAIFSLAAGLLPLALTAPLEKRALSTTDVSVLQLALFLEHLELNLYSGGCKNFTDAQYMAQGFPPGFRENVCVIAEVREPEATGLSVVTDKVPTNSKNKFTSIRSPKCSPATESRRCRLAPTNSRTPTQGPLSPSPT